MQTLANGSHLGGYTIVRLVGKGGMGEVYEAIEVKLQRRVAIKIIASVEKDKEDLLRRFLLEARTLAAINHPNVVTIYAIDRDQEIQFIAMEFVEGVSFKELLEDHPLSVNEALPIFDQMLEGLHCLHVNGILHRDIKPHNILLRPNGQIKILDFGIAQQVSAKEEKPARLGAVVGTVPYLAPEVKSGVPASMASDFWSLGAIFYECLVGQPLAIVMQEMPGSKDIAFPHKLKEKIPRDLRHFIAKMCAHQPENRYSAADAMEELRRIRYAHLESTGEFTGSFAPKPVDLTKVKVNRRRSTRRRKLPDEKYLFGAFIATVVALGLIFYPNYDAQPTHLPDRETASTLVSAPLNLLGPKDNELLWLDPTQTPTLSWAPALAPSLFKIQIASDQIFKDVLVQESVSGNFFRPGRLLLEGRYFWRLVPRDPNAVPISARQFRIAYLTAVELISPLPQASLQLKAKEKSTALDLKWNCKTGVTSYAVQLSRTEDFSKLSREHMATNCEWKRVSLKEGSTYWRVRPVDGPTNLNKWSEARVIVVSAAKPQSTKQKVLRLPAKVLPRKVRKTK